MSEKPLTVDTARDHVAEVCFRTGPIERVGVELEWLVHDAVDAAAPVPADRVQRVLSDCPTLPSGGLLSCEPGGQIEVSSSPGVGLAGCVADMTADLAVLRASAAAHRIALVGMGMDPVRPPQQVMDSPRYRAMDEHFAPFAPAGRLMMCSTASVQVCLDAGPGDPTERWRLAHAIGPVLVGAFANSPLREGRPTGWRSTRWAVWDRLAPGRTRPVTVGASGDVRGAYAQYALEAPVMCIRNSSDRWSVPENLSFQEWIANPNGQAPTLDDLDYHLSTLFPPVRARGYLELRMIDAQQADGWRVPLAVASALLDNPAASEAALAATEELHATEGDPWILAARDGLSHPALARAARDCFAAAEKALEPGELRQEVAVFREEYVERARCPADDAPNGAVAATA